ncbi:5,10-methylenetetrahydrofolate reductase [Candidatus Johnevansia muelleri]|uniref:Methylenetetrahydrofolate reductase n=1 Tax=Candidatus Johnevansia muelleri TaxID=1495769 RepID=A0A078KBI1_9GAMM|nr:5,10-methylenetetrahydrofolate reductase [Candidatus Evansia muelleri]
MILTKLDISFEFFPPITKLGKKNLLISIDKLIKFNPKFFSITFGACGNKNTFDTVLKIKNKCLYVNIVPHLSCISIKRNELINLLYKYKVSGIKSIVVLRGDKYYNNYIAELHYANELIQFIRDESGNYFELIVGAYPEMHSEAFNFEKDLNNFANKMKVGANKAITQYFYDARAYFNFIECLKKIGFEKPIIPGIMPINNFNKISHFSNICGASIPRWICKKFEAYGDDNKSAIEFSKEIMIKICKNLIEGGAPGLHFYTLNNVEPSIAILHELKNIIY